jgi:hypothetical protein
MSEKFEHSRSHSIKDVAHFPVARIANGMELRAARGK